MKNAKNLKGMGQYGTVGLEMVLSVLFGLFIGIKLDGWLGTSPWLAVVWFGFGCAAAGKSVHRAWKGMQADAKREEAEQGNPLPLFPDEKERAWEQKEKKEREEREALAKAGNGDEDGDAESALDHGEDRAKKPAGAGSETRDD